MLQLSQRPLMSTGADAALFVGREREVGTLTRAAGLGLNALLLGQRGSGKTSLLHHFERELGEAGMEVRFIEASGASTIDGLIALLFGAVRGTPWDSTDRLLAEMGEGGVGGDLRRLGEIAGGSLILLVDSIARPALVHQLFGPQRDELWQLPFLWVVSGNSADRRGYLEPPADSFFDVVVELEELGIEEAAELLVRRCTAPGTADDPAAKALLEAASLLAQRVSPRTPRQLLSAARASLLGDEDPSATIQMLYGLQHRAAALGRPAAMLFTELMNMGPVSASDEGLLERLGWTRGRVVQVLKELEVEGLVIAAEARGPGRPRKLYAVNHPGNEEGKAEAQ
jgi:hypothetical protein